MYSAELFKPTPGTQTHRGGHCVHMNGKRALKDSGHGQESQTHPTRLPTYFIFPLFIHLANNFELLLCDWWRSRLETLSPCEQTF